MIAEYIAELRERLGERLAQLFPARDDDAAEQPSTIDFSAPDARIAYWLPYRSFDDKNRVFVNRDSIGFCLEMDPLAGANEDIALRLKGLYARLPTDATLQVNLFASPDITSTLKRYASLRRMDDDADQQADHMGRPARNSNIFRQLARRRYAFLREASLHPMSSDVASLVRDFRVYLSVTLPGHIKDLNALDQLLDIRESMRSTLLAAGMPSVDVNAERLIDLLDEVLNPRRLRGAQRPAAQYHDPMRTIAEQVVSRDTCADWSDPRKVVLEQLGEGAGKGVELRFLSLLTPPKEFALWAMGALVGDLFQDSLQIPCPFMLTMGVAVPDQRSMRTSAIADKMQAERNATGDMAKFSPGLQDANEHWTNALKAVDAGAKLVWVYHQLMLYAEAGKGASAESAVRDLWRSRGFELAADAYITRMALLQSLPLSLSKPFVSDLRETRRMELRTSGNTIHLAPLLAEGKGTGTPRMLGVGRRGQLISLDFFDNTQAGKNVSIAGGVGAGKSTLLQTIAEAYAASGALVRVFEKGSSFERMCKLLGGQFLPFTRRSRVNVNPLSMVSKPIQVGDELVGGIDDDIALLQPLLAKMASPNVPLDPAVYASLAVVIKEEFLKYGPDTTITHIRDRYQRGRLYDDRPGDSRFFDMAVMLSPFAVGGAYADYFEGPSSLDFGNDFLVFEMQELSGNQHLYSVIQMILLYRVSREFLEDRHRQKVFILDEAKDVLAGSGEDDRAMGEFVERLYLRVRKHNGTAITASQDVAHWFTAPHGASIWNQSEYIVLGKQSENSIEAIARGEAIRLDDQLRRQLTSISATSGAFREWYVHSGTYKGLMRLVLDPATRLLLSNRAEDNVPLDRAIASGSSISEAIDELLRSRGAQVPA